MIAEGSLHEKLKFAEEAAAHYGKGLDKVAKYRGYLLPLGLAWLACAYGVGSTLAGGRWEREFLRTFGELGETVCWLGVLALPFVIAHLHKLYREAAAWHRLYVHEVRSLRESLARSEESASLPESAQLR